MCVGTAAKGLPMVYYIIAVDKYSNCASLLSSSGDCTEKGQKLFDGMATCEQCVRIQMRWVKEVNQNPL